MIDEATGDKILAAMALILRAQREDIDIIVRPDDLRVMIGMHTGQDQPKWLVNEMFALSNDIVCAAVVGLNTINATLKMIRERPIAKHPDAEAIRACADITSKPN